MQEKRRTAKAHDPKHITYHLLKMVDMSMCICSGAESLEFTDDVTAEESRMNFEVYRALLCAQIRSNAKKN